MNQEQENVDTDRETNRRTFLAGAAGIAAGMALPSWLAGTARAVEPAGAGPEGGFRISLATWSLHRAIGAGLKMTDVPRMLRDQFQIDGIEFVNTLFEVTTASYIDRLRERCEEAGVTPVLIMCDGEGELGNADPQKRRRAVRDLHKWIYAAADLGCHAIRVNWHGAREDEMADSTKAAAMIERSAEAFGRLVELGRVENISILIENHGGPSSNPDLLLKLIEKVGMPELGLLPDFGNFPDGIDRYEAVDRMMPYAKAVSAKSHDFDEKGNETKTDYARMIDIVVRKHGYHSWIGIEYEGARLSEPEGVIATRDLLRRLRDGKAAA